ncbi:MAG: A/G-specific adenine glycosylase [Propionibacteriaceae bacterium]|jgi:A/G-specific adenine glycosylase|nr:A/G-specific adenine glycosylase [Propionibacteriaceae bacterium]
MNPLVVPLGRWYLAHARPLPWRDPKVSAWGVLVSEIMLQQTPAARVIPYWESWMTTWPEPVDLAEAPVAEVIRAWGTLGYPRRALRLQECAKIITDSHGSKVPSEDQVLRGLPGIGEYTAAAVAAFAYGRRTVVLDTNIRRVLARAHSGEALPVPHLTTAEREMAARLVPQDIAESVLWNQSTMELGAILCQAREHTCEPCPVKELCSWREAGYPGDLYAGQRRTQGWKGTDRQARGKVMAVLREAEGERVPVAALLALQSPRSQMERALDGLIVDGLAVREGEAVRLP